MVCIAFPQLVRLSLSLTTFLGSVSGFIVVASTFWLALYFILLVLVTPDARWT